MIWGWRYLSPQYAVGGLWLRVISCFDALTIFSTAEQFAVLVSRVWMHQGGGNYISLTRVRFSAAGGKGGYGDGLEVAVVGIGGNYGNHVWGF